MISISLTTPSYSDEGLQKCDKALTLCDAALKDKDVVIAEQEKALKEKQAEILRLEHEKESVLNQPALWTGIGATSAVLAGPVAIPIVITVAILIQLIF